MKICVVGCGAAGLGTARQLVAAGFEATIYERSSVLGGTWVYTEQTGKDQYGLPIHTSMYKSLRTNLPKEVMGYPDFPIPDDTISYLPAKKILEFLESYADHFKLRPLIKFSHLVKNISPHGDKWSVTVVNLPSAKESTEIYDGVAVCNGHYHTPMYAHLDGEETFPGIKSHSHDYREPSSYTNKTVVVIGAGPSGIDLSLEIASTAKRVILSKRQEIELKKEVFPSNLEERMEISRISGSKISFRDGTEIEADVLFYCTGYKYNFPFLSPECGITVEDNYVEPLYKHLIHIERPTMALIGLPFYVCAFSLFDLQARLWVKFLKGDIKLPSKEEMLADTKSDMAVRTKLGFKRRQFHMMGPLQGDYYDQLAHLGNLKPLDPVMTALHNEASRRQLEDLKGFREDIYRIIDQENYVKVN